MPNNILTLSLNEKINILSQTNNYYNNQYLKILSNLTDEEIPIFFNNINVQKAILNINDTVILRTIFRRSPEFFQEIMFNDEKVQERLLLPRQSINKNQLFKIYNTDNISFTDEEIRFLENFLHTIKSSKIYDQLIENKLFKVIVALCHTKQLKPSFFRNIDVIKLFNNIVNDNEIYHTRIQRKKSIVVNFNSCSDHFLLPTDYNEYINAMEFLKNKLRHSLKFPKTFVDDKTLQLMSKEMIEQILEFRNIDTTNIKKVFENDIINTIKKDNYNYQNVFTNLINNQWHCFRTRDDLYFNIIISNFDKDPKLKDSFIDFVYNAICDNNLNDSEKQFIKNSLYFKMNNNTISKSDYSKLFSNHSLIKTIFYLKFGKISLRMDYLNGISYKQIMLLNNKHINQIIKELNNENEDEISNTYSYAIKLYFTFGLERTLKILKGDYGTLNRLFFDNVSLLKVDNVIMKKEGNKYIPSINNEFIDFMFDSQKNNHFIDMLDNKRGLLYKYWSYVYNNYDELKNKCHDLITLKKLNILLKKFSPTADVNEITPDNYRLEENDILNEI